MQRLATGAALAALALGASACAMDEADEPALEQEQSRDDRGIDAAVAAGRYLVVTLGSLGGTVSAGNGVNDLGWVAGTSTLEGNRIQHAALWRLGRITRPRHPRRPEQQRCRGRVKNNRGLIVGIRRDRDDEPLGESLELLGVLPHRDRQDLPRLRVGARRMRPCPRSAATTASPPAPTTGATSSAGPRPRPPTTDLQPAPGAPVPRRPVAPGRRDPGAAAARRRHRQRRHRHQ